MYDMSNLLLVSLFRQQCMNNLFALYTVLLMLGSNLKPDLNISKKISYKNKKKQRII